MFVCVCVWGERRRAGAFGRRHVSSWCCGSWPAQYSVGVMACLMQCRGIGQLTSSFRLSKHRLRVPALTRCPW